MVHTDHFRRWWIPILWECSTNSLLLVISVYIRHQLIERSAWLILDSKYIVCCHVLLQLALSTECSQLLPLYYKPFFVIPVVPIERTEKCCLFGVTTIIHRYFTPFYRYQCLPSFICMSIYSLFNMNYLKNASLQVNWICISFDIVCYKRAKCL